MIDLSRKSEDAAQVPVNHSHRRRLKLTNCGSAQAPAVNEAGVVDQCGRHCFQPGLLWRKSNVERVLSRCPRQGHDRGQRASGCVVQIGRNNYHRASGPLLMTLNRIQPAPEDLAPLDYHFSSGKSVADAFSQTAISARWCACSSGSSASRAKAALTSTQKTRSSISSRARRITCAFDWPSFDANLESVLIASPVMRTLVATFSIVQSYYAGQNDGITVVTVRRIAL